MILNFSKSPKPYKKSIINESPRASVKNKKLQLISIAEVNSQSYINKKELISKNMEKLDKLEKNFENLQNISNQGTNANQTQNQPENLKDFLGSIKNSNEEIDIKINLESKYSSENELKTSKNESLVTPDVSPTSFQPNIKMKEFHHKELGIITPTNKRILQKQFTIKEGLLKHKIFKH